MASLRTESDVGCYEHIYRTRAAAPQKTTSAQKPSQAPSPSQDTVVWDTTDQKEYRRMTGLPLMRDE